MMIDVSSKLYYQSTDEFTKWFNDNIGQNIINDDGEKVFNIVSGNNPDPAYEGYETSLFTQHKKEIMKDTINSSIQDSMARNKNNGTVYDFRLPKLTEAEWEQVLSNVSLIAFVQGVPLGMKYYNNYVIATSTSNNEYVSPNEIYFSVESSVESSVDKYYHKVGCEKMAEVEAMVEGEAYVGYRSTDFVVKSRTLSDGTKKYYYSHANASNLNSSMGCYYCVVNSTDYLNQESIDKEEIYYRALERERFIQNKVEY